MKRKYVLAALLLAGLGIVSTVAFQLTASSAEAPEAYTISTTGTDATITAIKIRPSKGGDRLILKFTLGGTDSNSYDIGIEFEDAEGTDGLMDLTGATINPAPTVREDSSGYIEYTHELSGSSVDYNIKIDLTDVYSDVDGLMILVSDTP